MGDTGTFNPESFSPVTVTTAHASATAFAVQSRCASNLLEA